MEDVTLPQKPGKTVRQEEEIGLRSGPFFGNGGKGRDRPNDESIIGYRFPAGSFLLSTSLYLSSTNKHSSLISFRVLL